MLSVRRTAVTRAMKPEGTFSATKAETWTLLATMTVPQTNACTTRMRRTGASGSVSRYIAAAAGTSSTYEVLTRPKRLMDRARGWETMLPTRPPAAALDSTIPNSVGETARSRSSKMVSTALNVASPRLVQMEAIDKRTSRGVAATIRAPSRAFLKNFPVETRSPVRPGAFPARAGRHGILGAFFACVGR
jgi:hypothetical protein